MACAGPVRARVSDLTRACFTPGAAADPQALLALLRPAGAAWLLGVAAVACGGLLGAGGGALLRRRLLRGEGEDARTTWPRPAQATPWGLLLLGGLLALAFAGTWLDVLAGGDLAQAAWRVGLGGMALVLAGGAAELWQELQARQGARG